MKILKFSKLSEIDMEIVFMICLNDNNTHSNQKREQEPLFVLGRPWPQGPSAFFLLFFDFQDIFEFSLNYVSDMQLGTYDHFTQG